MRVRQGGCSRRELTSSKGGVELELTGRAAADALLEAKTDVDPL
jgi:hypothetical protein